MKKAYLPRTIEPLLREYFSAFPVVVVSGARQVGKRSLLEHVFPQISRVVFDPDIDIENANADPDLFLNNRKPPIILDEIQYAPRLVSAIKRRLEKNRTPGQYLVTGSQQWEVMKSLSESLAGRTVFLDLDTFNLGEIQKNNCRSWLQIYLENPEKLLEKKLSLLNYNTTLFEQIWRGFYPEAQFLNLKLVPAFYEAYERTYLQRDVRSMADISDMHNFSRFFRLCAALTAQELNYNQLGRDLGITPQTAQRWLAILKASFQWFEIPAFTGNQIKRVSLKPKSYIIDTGIACHALAITNAVAIGGHPLWGALFETAVISEIKKQAKKLGVQPNFYHWRLHSSAEVDLIIEWNGQYYPIEIKSKTHPTKKDILGIASFQKNHPSLKVQKGLIINPGETVFTITEDVLVCPWNAVF